MLGGHEIEFGIKNFYPVVGGLDDLNFLLAGGLDFSRTLSCLVDQPFRALSLTGGLDIEIEPMNFHPGPLAGGHEIDIEPELLVLIFQVDILALN